MREKIKAIYNKEGYDYSNGFGDPKEFHTTFFFLIDAFQVTDEPYSKFSYFSKAYIMIVGTGVFMDAFLSFYHGLDKRDIFLITEAGTYVILLNYKLLIVISTFINLDKFHSLIQAIKEDFAYINTKNQKYRYSINIHINESVTNQRPGLIQGTTVIMGICSYTHESIFRKILKPLLDLGVEPEKLEEELECIKCDTLKARPIRDLFFQIQLTTWKASIWTVIFMICLGTGQILFAFCYLAYYYIVHTPGDGRVRKLLFPFWAPGIDYTTTPAFECAFTFANVGVAAYSYNYLFILHTDVIWIRQIASKSDLIVQCIKDLLVGITPAKNQEEKAQYDATIRFRMREIVLQTQLMYRLIEDYAAIYKKMLMYEQFFASPMICMLAYCFAEKLDIGEVQPIMMMLCIGASVTLYIPCYLCTFLRSKVTAISDACWETPFWNASPVIRTYMIMIMQRCLRPLPLQAPGFEEVSIKTFSNKMTSAYSLFNMLRQSNFEL